MIDYTPRRRYKEIVDYIPPKKDVIRGRIVGYLLLALYIVVIGWAIMRILLCGSIWHGIVYAIALIIIGLFIGVVFMFIHLLYSPGKPRLKADYAKAIKDVIGFDFGDDFKLLFTGGHDYEEYLYIFSKESFEPLKKRLDSIPDGKDDKTGRYVDHSFKGQQGTGFGLVKNRLDNNQCGNIESIEVDYKERTLKHKFVIY